MNKNYSIYDLLLFIFGCTVCLVIVVVVGGVVIFKIPTTPENAKVREILLTILGTIAGSVLTIVAQKFSAVLNKKDI